MKLISTVPPEMPEFCEGDIIAIDQKPFRVLSRSVRIGKDGMASDVVIQYLELETTCFKIVQSCLADLEDLYDEGRLEVCEDKNSYLIPKLEEGDEAVLNVRYKLLKEYVESVYPDFRSLQARGYEKKEMQQISKQLMLSNRQMRRLLLKFLQAGQTKLSLVDGRQTRKQRGYDPKEGAVRGVKVEGVSSEVLNNSELEKNFEEAYRYLESILNQKQFHLRSQRRPTAKMAYKWMIRNHYSYINDRGKKEALPKSKIPSYRRFVRWLRDNKFGGGKIRDHMIGHIDWINNRRLIVGDAHYGVHHPGELILIDETEVSLDLVTADQSRAGQNIGGAIIHLAVDAATNVYVGVTVTMQVNNSYEGVLNIFDSMLMDNNEKSEMLIGDTPGLEERAFPGGVIPEHILVDHGAEYTSEAIKENLTGGEKYFQLEGVPTDITLARVATGSDKGGVERPFGDFDRLLADATGYRHGYRSDTSRSKHRIEAHLNIIEFRSLIYEIVKNHNNSPLTSYPVTPELFDAVPDMTPLKLWDYLKKHYGSGITPGKTERNLYRYAIMPKKTLQISRKQISYKNFLFWDIAESKELYDIALRDKDKSYPIEVRIDPRTLSRIYYKERGGTVYVLPLARKRSNMRAFAKFSWSAFESWYDQYLKGNKKNQDKKEYARQSLFSTMNDIIEGSAHNMDIQSGSTVTTKGIREAGAIERLAITAHDVRNNDKIFGSEGLKIPTCETESEDDALSLNSAGALSMIGADEEAGTEDVISYNGFYGIDPDDY